MRRGEIRWYTFRRPDKRRPVLILTRDEVIQRLNEVIAAAKPLYAALSPEQQKVADDLMARQGHGRMGHHRGMHRGA